MKITSGLAK
ncbi:cytochrome c oxidase subunit 1 domain protein, partial [Chlamydia psittaci 02DC22]